MLLQEAGGDLSQSMAGLSLKGAVSVEGLEQPPNGQNGQGSVYRSMIPVQPQQYPQGYPQQQQQQQQVSHTANNRNSW